MQREEGTTLKTNVEYIFQPYCECLLSWVSQTDLKGLGLKWRAGFFYFFKDSTHRELFFLFFLHSLIPLTDTHLYTEIRMVDMTGGTCSPFAVSARARAGAPVWMFAAAKRSGLSFVTVNF